MALSLRRGDWPFDRRANESLIHPMPRERMRFLRRACTTDGAETHAQTGGRGRAACWRLIRRSFRVPSRGSYVSASGRIMTVYTTRWIALACTISFACNVAPAAPTSVTNDRALVLPFVPSCLLDACVV